jgi:hypothetical protein
MKPAQLAVVVAAALLLVVPAIAGEQDPQDTAAQEQESKGAAKKKSAWLVGIRFGGFTDNDHATRYGPYAKSAYYSPEPEVTGALDISRLFGKRSGVTLSLEGMAFAGDAVAVTPITVTYKYFVMGNGLNLGPGQGAPAVQPWVGFGGGLYTFVLDDRDIVRSRFGAQLSSGLLIPLGRHFDVLGELRYAMSSDTRILSYTMGFGLHF